MKIKLISIILIVAIGTFYNGHLLMLQIYGWGSMLSEYYSSSQSIEVAIDKTFSGDNKCGICGDVNGYLNKGYENKAKNYVTLEFKPVILSLPQIFNIVFQNVYHGFIDLTNSSLSKRFDLPFIHPPKISKVLG